MFFLFASCFIGTRNYHVRQAQLTPFTMCRRYLMQKYEKYSKLKRFCTFFFVLIQKSKHPEREFGTVGHIPIVGEYVGVYFPFRQNVAHKQHYFKNLLPARNKHKAVAVVAVLQFQNRFYKSQKLTLYLYINIEVFLGYGNSFSRTATLQHCNKMCKPNQKKYRKMKNFL